MLDIFFLESDVATNNKIKNALQNRDCNVFSNSGLNFNFDEFDKNFDIYLLGTNFGSIRNIDILNYIKNKNKHAKVIFISNILDFNELNLAYQNGCDDYIKPPFSIEELFYKIELFKKSQEQNVQKIYTNLTKYENKLLNIFIKNKNLVLTSEQICFYLYGEFKNDATLRSMIRRLRQQLINGKIINIKGLGYKFVCC
ncbi:response regulator [Campylobacter ureolyticus]|uniref:Transcriptional regulatory protein CssR n=1 Tax=Campylobacter ureolyticus TaxID=827 RepID=A0A6N2T9L4_9BACT